MYELKISLGEKSHTQEISNQDLANISLEVAGGGYTSEQTAEAMTIQQKLKEGKPITYKGNLLQITNP